MTHSPDPLDRLGDVIARERERAIQAAGVVAAAEQRWLGAPRRPRQRRRMWPVVAGVGGLAVAAVVLLVGWPAPPLSGTADGAPIAVGAWLETPADRESALTFSDGTTILVAGATRMRVRESESTGAAIEVERGRVLASVQHLPKSRWRFGIGPYDVDVTGTQFDASWDAGHEEFVIEMSQGSVVVRGPRIDGARTIIAGQRVRIGRPTRTEARSPTAPPAVREGTAEPPRADDATAPPTPAMRVREAATVRAPDVAESAGWVRLASDGRYDEALAAADRSGFDELCEHLGARQALELGDVARYAHSRAQARSAYQAVRRRFAHRPAAADAAFALGILEFPSPRAASWFDTYLQEAPRGALAREALGRLMEVHHRADHGDEASALARRYLDLYPTGPHAALAHTLAP